LAIDTEPGRARKAREGAMASRQRDYQAQLGSLAETFEQIHDADVSALSAALASVDRRQATYVGSGGAFGVARLAAELHEARTRSFARAATPLELIGSSPLSESAVVIFSAGARHPDAAAATTAALRNGADPVVLVTHRQPDELASTFSAEIRVIHLPGPRGREGFLATNSVMAMSAALIKASGFDLPIRLPNLNTTPTERFREQTLILSAPGLGAVSTDLETRLSETGLSAAQVTDYRNFAHGRHTGLARNIHQTTIVALVDPPIEELARRTLGLLPEDAHVAELRTGLPWPVSELDLLAASMQSISPSAEASNFDPARPKVPQFGRKLYHLSSRALIGPAVGPVDRKLAALRLGGPGRLRQRYEKAAELWLGRLRDQYFDGFVFDYDGTVCATDDRFELPEPPVREEIVRLLHEGAVIGFASGRGGSIHRDLREWVPKKYWHQIELGLYNGGLLLNLSEQLGDRAAPLAAIDEAMRRINRTPFASVVELSEREHQLGISPVDRSGVTLEAMAQVTQELIAVPPSLPLKVTLSGHSIDVIPADSAKTKTSELVRLRAEGEILAFGDQGQLGGNDFELLAETQWSLSVDRVSGDPTRCWNLDTRGERGPDLLRRYLRSLKRLRRGFAYRPAR